MLFWGLPELPLTLKSNQPIASWRCIGILIVKSILLIVLLLLRNLRNLLKHSIFCLIVFIFDLSFNYLAHTRAIYDQYGLQGLQLGVPDGKGGYTGGAQYQGNADEIFQAFYGSYNPFSNVFGEYGSFNSAFPFDQAKNNPPKIAPTVINVPCTLEELYTGVTKHITVSRKRFDILKNLSPQDKTFEIVVSPGFKNGTKITFPLEGDEGADATTGDLQFVIEELPHATFVRSKSDLILTSKILLRDALCAVSVSVEALDGRKFNVPIDEIVTPTYKKIIEGEGMPDTKTKAKGNLILAFEIIFPKSLSSEAKKQLQVLLK